MEKFVASEDVSDARMKICIECPALIHLTKTCSKCGCFMSLKTKLLTAGCPDNKW